MFISFKVNMVTSIKIDQKFTLMMKMRRDHQTLNGKNIGDVRTEGGQSRTGSAGSGYYVLLG